MTAQNLKKEEPGSSQPKSYVYTGENDKKEVRIIYHNNGYRICVDVLTRKNLSPCSCLLLFILLWFLIKMTVQPIKSNRIYVRVQLSISLTDGWANMVLLFKKRFLQTQKWFRTILGRLPPPSIENLPLFKNISLLILQTLVLTKIFSIPNVFMFL